MGLSGFRAVLRRPGHTATDGNIVSFGASGEAEQAVLAIALGGHATPTDGRFFRRRICLDLNPANTRLSGMSKRKKPPDLLPDGFCFHGQGDRNMSGGVLLRDRLVFGRSFVLV